MSLLILLLDEITRIKRLFSINKKRNYNKNSLDGVKRVKDLVGVVIILWIRGFNNNPKHNIAVKC